MARGIDIFRDFDFRRSNPISDSNGDYVAELVPSKNGGELLVEPKSGQNIRNMAALTIEIAKANPATPVGFDFSGNYYPVQAKDRVTDVIIRFHDEPGIGRSKPGGYLSLTSERKDFLEAEISAEKIAQEANIQLFDVLIDAIRLSRQNGGKAIQFTFNQYAMKAKGTDDAEKLESRVLFSDRVTNVPPPPPPKEAEPPEPVTKLGRGYSVKGGWPKPR